MHPLNVEVIGWLSAQNYTFSLFFSLLSMIALDVAIGRVRRLKEGVLTHMCSLASLLWVVLAVLCKGPAIAVPAVQVVYLLQEWVCNHDTPLQRAALLRYIKNHSFHLCLTTGTCIRVYLSLYIMSR